MKKKYNRQKSKEEIRAIKKLPESRVYLPFHQAHYYESSPRCFKWKNIETKKFLKEFEKDYGFIPTARKFSVISIGWANERGFGEYLFWQDNGQIYCNSLDKRETVKRILCSMVDQAIFIDE